MAYNAQRIRAHRFFYRLLQLTLGTWLRLRFNIHTRNRHLLHSVNPPYLILPNHAGYWDPFMLATFAPRPVYFLTADTNFRTPLLRRLLGMVGAIPKSKGISDLEAVRQLLRLRDRGEIISLFAEGERTWDGGPLQIMPATAKLVRLLGIPVVTAVFDGGHVSHPRWARHPRRGRLTIEFRLTFEAEELRSLTLPQIEQRLTSAIGHDDWATQQRHLQRFCGRRRAETLEHVLHVCPSCHGVGRLRSRDTLLFCTACGYRVGVDHRGLLQPQWPADPAPPPTVRQWNLWQQPLFRCWVEQRRLDPARPLLGPVVVRGGVGYRSRRLRPLAPGTLQLNNDRLLFRPSAVARTDSQQPAPISFDLSRLEGLNVQLSAQLEFYYCGKLYSFVPQRRSVSFHMWRNAIRVLQESV